MNMTCNPSFKKKNYDFNSRFTDLRIRMHMLNSWKHDPGDVSETLWVQPFWLAFLFSNLE